MKDLLKILDVLANEDSIKNSLDERTVGRDNVKNRNLTVSTVYTQDMGYETAIIDDGEVYPVERYKTKELAADGHKKWLNKLEIRDESGRIPSKAFDLKVLGYGSICAPKTVRLKN